jgi:hypothetical protein
MAQTGSMVMGTEAASNLLFITNATEAARLDSTGNLGLGVTPSAWSSSFKALQVSPRAALWGDTSQTILSHNIYATSGGDLYIANGNATLFTQQNGAYKWLTSASGTAGNAITFTQAMTLDASGNLGLGTTSPSARLSVSNSAGGNVASFTDTTSADLQINLTSGVSLLTPSTGILAFGTSSTERARIDSSGNFGIGTSSPSTYGKLVSYNVGGGAYAIAVVGNDQSNNRIRLKNIGGGGGDFTIVGGTPGISNAGLAIFDETNGVTRMLIDSSGNMSLGNTAAGYVQLQPAGNIRGVNASGVGGDTLIAAINGVSNGYQITTTTGNVQTYKWNTGGTQTMTLDASGNLLVGITSGSYKFMVGDGTRDMCINPNSALDAIFLGTTTNKPLVFGTNNAERARIDSSGNLLVGATSVISAGKYSSSFAGATENGIILQTTLASTGSTYIGFVNSSSSIIGSVTQNGASTVAYNTSSDYRLKNTIAPMTGALAKVALLKPCTYKWNADGSDGEGFIAHELAEVVPECVTGEKDAVDADGNPKYQGIDTSFLVATLTAAIQEQQAIIESLKARLDAANL